MLLLLAATSVVGLIGQTLTTALDITTVTQTAALQVTTVGLTRDSATIRVGAS